MSNRDTDLSDDACAARLRTALDLMETGIELRLSQFRREFPDASEDEVYARLREWMRTRPDAAHGDAPGRPVDPDIILGK